MKVRFNGLEFTFPRRVRTILISEPHQLDEEMMILFRAAVHTSKSRST